MIQTETVSGWDVGYMSVYLFKSTTSKCLMCQGYPIKRGTVMRIVRKQMHYSLLTLFHWSCHIWNLHLIAEQECNAYCIPYTLSRIRCSDGVQGNAIPSSPKYVNSLILAEYALPSNVVDSPHGAE